MIKSVFIVMAIAAMQPKYTNQSAWKMLREGQTEQQAIQCLGDPKDKESTSKVAIWYYQETPTRENGKVVDRPKFGTVVFRAEKAGQFTVEKFIEPDWTKIEQPKTPTAPVSLAPAPRPAAPTVAAPPVQALPIRPAVQPTPQNTNHIVQPAQPVITQPAADRQVDRGSKYFVYGGIAFIVIAVVIAIAHGSKLFF